MEASDGSPKRPKPFLKRRKRRTYPPCVACRQSKSFTWTCRRCDTFSMCQTCMDDNLWGMTCNNITWTCPDCGHENSYGNR
ncbi:MAG: hypothetical protein HQL54_07550 [Magnetococcales bacterium]|nr:hypothetical protein [Magnetococcales bacterium]